MNSLQTIAIKTIIKNDLLIPVNNKYLTSLVIDFCEKYPEELDSPENYWKFYASYTSLAERKVECKYKGPSTVFPQDTFLNDDTNITTKFINNEMNKYVKVKRIESRHIANAYVPFKATFELTKNFIKHANSRYKSLEIITTITRSCALPVGKLTKYIPSSIRFEYLEVIEGMNDFTDYLLTYEPMILIVKTQDVVKLIANRLSSDNGLNNQRRPVLVFDNELQFADDCATIGKRPNIILKNLLNRIHWFRSSPHSHHMSELHFVLRSIDVAHRVACMINLYPSIYFVNEVKDESPGEVQTDEA